MCHVERSERNAVADWDPSDDEPAGVNTLPSRFDNPFVRLDVLAYPR